MKFKLSILCIMVVLALSAHATIISPDNSNIQYVGRVDFTNPIEPVFSWPGTAMIVNFEGTSIKGTFDDDNSNNRLWIFIDGGEPTTLRLARRSTQFVLAEGLADTVHTMRIVKKTESCCGSQDFSFTGFELDAGKNLVAPPARPSLRLEYYGDSHVSGYSVECPDESWEEGCKNVELSYAGITSNLLGAEYSAISWSGIGMFTNTNMFEVWNRTLARDATPLWDFNQWTPDAVIIGLGDNDEGSVTQEVMIQGWEDFVTQNIRPVYPNAHIVFVASTDWSPTEPGDYMHIAVNNLQAGGDTNISIVYQSWWWWNTDPRHADACEQCVFANDLAVHLDSILGLGGSPAQCDFGCPPSGGICGDATCDPGEDQCNCSADCGTPPATETNCTDGIDEDCDGGADCADPTGDCDSDPACQSACNNNGTCETGEDCNNCPNDCISKTSGNPNSQYCCGDGTCEGAEDSSNCSVDCGSGPVCGDGTCDPGEDNSNCPADCPPPACNNNSICEPGEDCNNCGNDCDGVTGGNPANRYCCGNGVAEGPEGDGTICDGNY